MYMTVDFVIPFWFTCKRGRWSGTGNQEDPYHGLGTFEHGLYEICHEYEVGDRFV